jgi:FAD-linked sulfhydryl oxidase
MTEKRHLSKEKEACDACTAMGMEEQFKRTISFNLNQQSQQSQQFTNKNNNNNNSNNKNYNKNNENGDFKNGFWEMKPPPDVIKLGKNTWTLLHTMAAYYPERPTQERKKDTLTFLESLAKVYPCNVCANDFGEQMKTNPPKLESQKQFAEWMCDVHNDINVQLGKPKFDCSQVDKRWKLFVRGTIRGEKQQNNSNSKQ